MKEIKLALLINILKNWLEKLSLIRSHSSLPLERSQKSDLKMLNENEFCTKKREKVQNGNNLQCFSPFVPFISFFSPFPCSQWIVWIRRVPVMGPAFQVSVCVSQAGRGHCVTSPDPSVQSSAMAMVCTAPTRASAPASPTGWVLTAPRVSTYFCSCISLIYH